MRFVRERKCMVYNVGIFVQRFLQLSHYDKFHGALGMQMHL
jgi:hypothetical protein